MDAHVFPSDGLCRVPFYWDIRVTPHCKVFFMVSVSQFQRSDLFGLTTERTSVSQSIDSSSGGFDVGDTEIGRAETTATIFLETSRYLIENCVTSSESVLDF